MKLTKTTDFGMRILIYLAKQNELATMPVISETLSIPYNNLTKLTQNLAKAGIIHTKKGKSGGIKLLMKPEDITLKIVVDLIDGPTTLSDCQKSDTLCTLSCDCKLKDALSSLQKNINNLMTDITVKQLL
jgi:Rrf2 family transcriptional regulator, nitric oxide-sensitive transcriptional repressor